MNKARGQLISATPTIYGNGQPIKQDEEQQQQQQPPPPEEQEFYELTQDIYTMIFLGSPTRAGFMYAIATAALKMILYILLAIELASTKFVSDPETRLVSVAQLVILPVAVAIQNDLITSFTKIANVQYDPDIVHTITADGQRLRHATRTKWALSIALRLLDGLMSISANFVLLLQAPQVLSLLLNFAALQFLQDIDNVAFGLAEQGYITDHVQHISLLVSHNNLKLPRRSSRYRLTKLDTVLFLLTYLILFSLFVWCTIVSWDKDDKWIKF